MNGYTFPRSGKHATNRLSRARNETRRPKHLMSPQSFFERLCFGAKTLFCLTRARPHFKLWRAVQRRRGARSNYYVKPQESGV